MTLNVFCIAADVELLFWGTQIQHQLNKLYKCGQTVGEHTTYYSKIQLPTWSVHWQSWEWLIWSVKTNQKQSLETGDHGPESAYQDITQVQNQYWYPWTFGSQPAPQSAERISTTSCPHVTLHHTFWSNFSQMHRKQSNWRKAKYPQRKKGSMSSVKGVSHLSRRAKRRLYCKLQLWMWRKWREKCRFAIFKTKKQACRFNHSSCLSTKTQPQKNKSAAVSSLEARGVEGALRRQNRLQNLCQSGRLSDTFLASSFSQNVATDTSVPARNITMCSPKTCTHPVRNSAVEPLLHTGRDVCGLMTQVIEQRTLNLSPSLEADNPSDPGQDQAENMNADVRTASKNTPTCRSDASLKALEKDIHGKSLILLWFTFLFSTAVWDDSVSMFPQNFSIISTENMEVSSHFRRVMYWHTWRGLTLISLTGTFVFESWRPLSLQMSGCILFFYLCRKAAIFLEVDKYRSAIIQKPVPSFQVVYRKHTLTLDDLSTLADQNWLNDQVLHIPAWGDLCWTEIYLNVTTHMASFCSRFWTCMENWSWSLQITR